MSNSGVPKKRAVLQKSIRKIFNFVCNKATPEQWAQWLRVPLEHVAAAGDVSMVDDLLASGADGTGGWKCCHHRYDRSLLYAGVQSGNPKVVSALLTAGAWPDINVCYDEKQRSPLHHAASDGHEAIAKLLLVAGTNVKCVDRDGNTPLQLAVEGGYDQVVLDLLESGAPPNSKDSRRDTPLHHAARRGHKEIVSLLLRLGADVNMLNRVGHCPLFVAACSERRSIMVALLKAGADIRQGVFFSSLGNVTSEGHMEVLRELLHGVGTNAKDLRWGTALIWACMSESPEAVDLLLRWGADETSLDIWGASAEQFLPCHSEDAERVRRLLANAPADRTWRRRGLLALCRAFPDKARLASANIPALGSEQTDSVSGCTAVHVRCKTPEGGVDDLHGGAAGADKGTATVEGAGAKDSDRLCSVEAMVIGLEQDDVFRHIVSFL